MAFGSVAPIDTTPPPADVESPSAGIMSGALAGTAIAPGWGTVIGAGIGLLGGILGNKSSAKQAEKQMSFQERMSNTAHQREVQDLRAAGLNPILSGTGGAGSSTPGGAMAQQQDVLTPAVNSGLAAYKAEIESKTAAAAIDNVHMDSANKGESANLAYQQARTQSAIRRNTDQNTAKQSAETFNAKIQSMVLQKQAGLIDQQTLNKRVERALLEQEEKLRKIDVEIAGYSAYDAKIDDQLNHQWTEKHRRWVDRYGGSVKGLINPFKGASPPLRRNPQGPKHPTGSWTNPWLWREN